MNTKLLCALSAVLLVLLPRLNYAQTAPDLGTAANFVLFTSVGAVTNSSTSQLTGDVGSNSGSSTGFGNVNGVMNDGDAASAQCATDLLAAYNVLNAETPTFFPSTSLGGGDTLVAGVYYVSAAATIDGQLVLNAQGNPNAVFIFQIEGSLSTAANTKVKLINSGLACNVFWKVEGLVSLASGTTIRGTIIANNAAITMNTSDTLEGRALSTAGAVSVGGILAYTPIGCGSVLLTGPAAPVLGATACYGLFSSDGAVSNSGITHVTGDVGSNTSAPTGFLAADVAGTIHTLPDTSTATSATNLSSLYTYLDTLTYDIQLLYPAQFGNNLVLTPHTYLMNAAVTFTDTVFLNAEGDSDAIFVIQVNGAFATSTFADVMIINGTQAKNVFWKIDGALNIAGNSIFNGTIVCNDASVIINSGVTLNGRALATTGSITTTAITVNANVNPGAGTLTGPSAVCIGSSVTLTDAATGGAWSSSNAKATVSAGIVTGVASGIDTIKYIASSACGADTAIKMITIGLPADAGSITGASGVCSGATTTLTEDTTGGTWSSSSAAATVSGGVVTGVTNGTAIIRYIVSGTCGADTATKTITVNDPAGAITGLSAVCTAASITLADTVSGGIWSSSNAHATVSDGIVTGVTAGTDTIKYAATGTCGTGTAAKIITISLPPDAGVITGASSVCTGSSVTMSESVTGGVWSSANTTATVVGASVTGAMAGIDTVKYTVTAGCGSATATKTITVNAAGGLITGLTDVCSGSSITLADTASGGTWSASNTKATVSGGIVTGVTAGTDTIKYTSTGTCGTGTAAKAITISATPVAGSITGLSSVCTGSAITFTESASGGTWSATNAKATVAGGIVTGITAGMDTIRYIVTNACGSASATKTVTINTVPYAGIITGTADVCAGSSITLTDTATGIWSASNAKATVAGGVVTGVTAGTDTITYTTSGMCGTGSATKAITISVTPVAGVITGLSSVCTTAAITLTASAPGGTWSASNARAAVAGGLITGIAAGIDTIKYMVTNACGSASTTKMVTINTVPGAGVITGLTDVCAGTSVILTDTATGGIWSATGASATISGGIVTGVSAGTDTITYTTSGMCGTGRATKVVMVSVTPVADSIVGLAAVCAGSVITLTDGTVGGLWSSSSATAAVADGIVTGTTPGNDTITYTVANACGTATATKSITVDTVPDAGDITGPAAVCVGSSITLAETVAGGTWSSSSLSATLSGSTVTGTSAGTDVVTYTFTNACATAATSALVTIYATPAVPVITTAAPSSVCLGTMYQNFGVATPPSGATAYEWTASNATVFGQGFMDQYALVNFTTAGTASVTLTASIPGTACVSSSTVVISVGAGTSAAATVTYTGITFACTTESTYQWGFDNLSTLDPTILAGATSQDYIDATPDFINNKYWVMTTEGSCMQKTYYDAAAPASVQGVTGNEAAGMAVYPNPASGIINVSFSGAIRGDIEVSIFNMTGQKMNTIAATGNNATIDVSALPEGNYLISGYSNGLKIANAEFIKN